ncbi:myotubularin-related protein 3 [Oncorhynchus mykiss]|uniref:Myotubularin-related protein 3 n=1 Tax=Oncorhynchus mykiss TaxID=8022 RepID=C1BF65_ONCMY|nr:myotubularin-related protein 3 [Oncorhynchus mykiss]ACO07668.1 Myotubularin-related protein 3 [Oncorhynchus mykiss]CDQ71217.1 unnamed protein product [Oncorhynchus mykiss]
MCSLSSDPHSFTGAMEEEEEGQESMECIQANQIFPRKPPVLEEESLQVPFPELHGEFTEYVGRAEDAIIAMSRYRLHIKFKESIVNSESCEVSVSAYPAVPACPVWCPAQTGLDDIMATCVLTRCMALDCVGVVTQH